VSMAVRFVVIDMLYWSSEREHGSAVRSYRHAVLEFRT